MEKLIYVLWKSDALDPEGFKREMLARVVPQLYDLGARRVSANIADEHSANAAHLRITHLDETPSATVSFWLATHLDRAPLERALAEATKRAAGYLVLESVPIVNTKHPPGEDERIAALCTVALLEKPAGMDYEAWREQWQGHHTKVAIETQSTFLYIQNVVVRALTPGAPPWTAIVEECFPPAAATDPMVFYAAGGSQEKLAENQRRMIDSCRKFIDFATLELHPMTAYVLKGAARRQRRTGS
jgi:hypothetical protein